MRADKFLSEKFGSRAKAKDALVRGLVFRNGRALSPSDEVSEKDALTFSDVDPFVSNGGKKLERALSVFGLDVCGAYADLGASTGGFTDCLLRHGARRVFCVDVGESQLAPSLCGDPRVVVMDRTNARYLTAASFPEPLDGIVADLSFISLRLMLPVVCALLPAEGRALLLFKPQFECEGRGLGKSGILPKSYHGALLRDFYAECVAVGLAPMGVVNAPIVPKKNIEYVVSLRKGGRALCVDDFLAMAEKIL